MAKIFAVLKGLLGLTLMGLLVWAAYKAITTIVHSLAGIESDLAVAIIAASTSVTVSILSLVISKILESRATITQELRAKKAPIYEEFIATLYREMFAEKVGEKPMSQSDRVKFFAKYTEKLTIWGSDGVIKAWRTARMSAINGVEGIDLLFQYENLLLEIRKDLGHKNRGFSKGTLLGLFVDGIDKYR